MSPKDADGMANSVDPDQTAPPLGVSVRKLRIITVQHVDEICLCSHKLIWSYANNLSSLLEIWYDGVR